MTGAAYVGWEGTYSFNFSGRRVPVESVRAMTFPQAPLTGQLDFTAAGSGLFESPQYNVRMSVSDLFVKDEGIGEVTARLTIRDNTLGIEMDAASPRLIVSGTGRISMTDEYDAELTFRFTDTSLDPYVRTFQPELSPFTTAVASGTVRVTGELINPQHLRVDARADALTLRLFDYVVRNDGPLRVAYEQEVVRLDEFRLVGDGTRLDVGGTIDLGAEQIAIRGDRRREPRDPPGVPARPAQFGAGRPGCRHHRSAGHTRSSPAAPRLPAAASGTSRCRTRWKRSTAASPSTHAACGWTR